MLQGSSIYSKTAADNYGNPDIFLRNVPLVPAKRLGRVEEASLSWCPPVTIVLLSTIAGDIFVIFAILLCPPSTKWGYIALQMSVGHSVSQVDLTLFG